MKLNKSLYHTIGPLDYTGKTDPYVTLRLGDQVISSKKNSQTTVIGPPGEPIWNQVCLPFFTLFILFLFDLQNFVSSSR